jgi:acetolactate synthase-1/2/3 large subunit
VTATATSKQDQTATGDQRVEPETISGGHLVAKALRAEGIDVIFTLCGGHIIDIYDGCIDEGIRIVDVRHEQVAAHAADGYARVTGRPGCAVVTAGRAPPTRSPASATRCAPRARCC